ncbi:hypothetical protein G6O67_006237 [Ophiocordyceps sinensis]|uniref:Uncharacterized protein n=2 Tax=Ophiocordyceps sinensis TaxID=72228 RepID=A0A8H4LVI6_9HYPO|nr:hypothetical protein OCS_02376 [Ophiocordyceps sinensis CO18]KAF4506120.1 hypothetical protein G6O67_006237 [Ophiocordyceps sinensis]
MQLLTVVLTLIVGLAAARPGDNSAIARRQVSSFSALEAFILGSELIQRPLQFEIENAHRAANSAAFFGQRADNAVKSANRGGDPEFARGAVDRANDEAGFANGAARVADGVRGF